MEREKRNKTIKGYAVLMRSHPYTPAEWYGCLSIFRTKSDAITWQNKKVHPGNESKVVEVNISYEW